MTSSRAICEAALRAVNWQETCTLSRVADIVKAPRPLVAMALDMLVACHEIAITGHGDDKLYMRLP
jgi:hypothetical protein